MVNRSKAIGTSAESAVVKACKDYGFSHAHRNSLHGAVDVGDIWIHPHVVIEVKGGQAANTASDGQLDAWMKETRTERNSHDADIGILVTTRKGVGPKNADRWHAYLTIGELHLLTAVSGFLPVDVIDYRVRLSLGDVLTLLHIGGYGPGLETT
jgi:hypothetical protein